MLLHRDIKKELADECVDTPDTIVSGEDDKKIYLKDFWQEFFKIGCFGRFFNLQLPMGLNNISDLS